MRAKEFITERRVAEGSEDYNGIQLSLEVEKDDEYVDDEDTDNQTIYVKATANGRELGHVLFTIDYDSQGMILKPEDLEVEERFRGQGIAATMYDYVKSKGYRIRRSGQQTDAGAGFWAKHKPGKNIWEQGVMEGTNNITYKQQKGKNKFSVEMLVDGKPAGMFQYDANTGRTITELDPAYRGQGLGQQLILKGIYTAAMLGMDYVEDESRTAMFDRALDGLADAGYIVNDEEYWYVTDTGEQFLKQGVISEYKATGRVGTSGPIKLGNLYKNEWPVIKTPISNQYEVRIDNNNKEYPEYYFYNKETGACVGQFALNASADSSEDAAGIVKPGVMIVEPHITLASEVQGKGLGSLIYRTFLSDGNRVFATHSHSKGAGALWNKVATGDIISVLYNAETGQVVSPDSKESQFAVRILGHKNKLKEDKGR